MNGPRLTQIEVEGFRGFAVTQRIDLDADVVLVRGDNGSGKTSLIDAILWLFCGELSHLAERVKGLRRTEDAIVNRYSTPPARVRLVVNAGGNEWAFERIGTGNQSDLRVSSAVRAFPDPSVAVAQLFGSSSFEQLQGAVKSWGILRQDAVKIALDAGSTLHARLAGVVGLERVRSFTDSATKTKNDLVRERTRLRKVLDDLRAEYVRSEQRAAEMRLSAEDPAARERLLAARFSLFAEELPRGIKLVTSPAAEPQRLAEVGTELGRIVDVANRAAEARIRAVSADEGRSVVAKDLETELRLAEQRATEASTRAPITVQLASAALELLGDTCPVCGQAIDEASVRTHLNEVLDESRAAAAAAADSQLALARARTQFAEAKAVEERRVDAGRDVQMALQSLRAVLTPEAPVQIEEEWLQVERIPALAGVLTTLRDNLRALYAELGHDRRAALSLAEREVSDLALKIGDGERAVAEAEARCQRATDLDRAAHAAAERVVDRALKNLQPSFAEVFDRLAPHPAFTELRAKQDLFYGKNQVVPEVYDRERRVPANPMLVFSEGQLNVVALSYFLGMAMNARDGALPFLILDDPLQSMDVLNVLGFADLCRRLREERQLIVTTHDRLFADVLTRKLAPRESSYKTLLHEFEAWTRDGPVLKTSVVPEAEVTSLLARRSA